MRWGAYLACGFAMAAGVLPAAAMCPGNPNAIGTSRVLTVSPTEFARIGTQQYPRTLPLAHREVVLTFDDGPIPPYTTSILNTLAAECVKATFFMVGRQAANHPDLARRVYQAGHTIGTHSQNHPLTFDRMPLSRAQREIDDGIASVSAALGDARAVAPFFRIPGLLRTPDVEGYLASRSLAAWSVDVVADDWYRSSNAQTIVNKVMHRLDHKGRGIVLLHDIQPGTAQALPMLLRRLKAGGYRIVQVVPNGERPKMPDVIAGRPEKQGWPRVTNIRQPQQMAYNTRPRGKPKARRYSAPPPATGSIQRSRPRHAENWTVFQR
jgi:peptidoglycan/xylan/chitin deacetylase (PgdA/CDA1 family)